MEQGGSRGLRVPHENSIFHRTDAYTIPFASDVPFRGIRDVSRSVSRVSYRQAINLDEARFWSIRNELPETEDEEPFSKYRCERFAYDGDHSPIGRQI